MDDQTDDRNPGIPPVGTPGELEEALKWLEELTARQGKTADVKNQSAAPTLDSPFRGLIDSEDGDLPDWLREVPKPHDANLEENEPESRLDWLSKMAQRESIEELPTLEWRRLSEPTQSAILAAQADKLPADLQLKVDEESEDIRDDIDITDNEASFVDESAEIEGQSAEFPLGNSEAEEQEEEQSIPNIAEGGDEEIEGFSDLVEVAGIGELSEESDADEPAEMELETAEFEPDDYPTPMDDLDAAMAWIEELAASQDAPVEEIPSVADRALASKLMMDAGLTPIVSPLDELGSETSLLDSLTPTHPFIEEEDFADTIVLVETLTADQEEEAVDFPGPREDVEIIEPFEGHVAEVGPVVDSALETGESRVDEAAVEESSFEEAMAYLDEMAEQQEDVLLAEPSIIDFDPETAASEEPTGETDAFSDAPIVEEQVVEDIEIEPHFAEEEISEDFPIEDVTIEDQLIKEPFVEADMIDNESVEDKDNEAGAEVFTATEVFTAQEQSDIADDEAALWMTEETESDSLSAADVPWLDSVVTAAVVGSTDEPDKAEPDYEPISEAANAGGQGGDGLEATLLSLDALALPSGKSLEEISAHLQTAQTSSWRDVDSALDWLEAALAKEPTAPISTAELDDIDLLERMPEDPDAVLAWLEQMAAEEEQRPTSPSETHDEPSDVITTAQQAGSFVEELTETDLLNMPDDPDEAMVWLESLAQGRGTVVEATTVEEDVTTNLPQPELSEVVEAVALETETADEVATEPESISFVEPAAAVDDIDSEAELFHSSEVPVEDVAIASEYAVETELPTTEQVEVDTSFDPLGGLSESDLDLILGSESEEVVDDSVPEITSAMEAVEQAPEPATLEESPTPEPLVAAQSAKPTGKRGRAKSTAHQEESPASEPSLPATPEPERATTSWVDLLKPLE